MTDSAKVRFRKLRGYVYSSSSENKRRQVDGFAFQTPGRDHFHMWITPSLELGESGLWHASHWETGMRVTDFPGLRTRAKAARRAIEILKHKSEPETEAAINYWLEHRGRMG